jgi:hypothetical protein
MPILNLWMLMRVTIIPIIGKDLVSCVAMFHFILTLFSFSFFSRNNWMRSRFQDHQTTFEFLQADLESTIETLSDVVARRRLRAGKDQIMQVTVAAKQKRVEFEIFLSSYAAAKASSATATPNGQAAMNRLDAFTSRASQNASRVRRRHRDGRSSNTTGGSGSRGRQQQQRMIDFSDARELSALLLELELATSLNQESSGSGGEGNGTITVRQPGRPPRSANRAAGNPYYSATTNVDRSTPVNNTRRRNHRPRRTTTRRNNQTNNPVSVCLNCLL